MKDFNEEIKKLIENDLPSQVGQALKKKLEQADHDHKELQEILSENRRREESILVLKRQITSLAKIVEKSRNLDDREKDVEKREYKQKLFEVNAMLAAADATNNKIMNFVDSLMRNTTYRENVYKNRECGPYNSNTCRNDPGEETGHDKTKTAE